MTFWFRSGRRQQRRAKPDPVLAVDAVQNERGGTSDDPRGAADGSKADPVVKADREPKRDPIAPADPVQRVAPRPQPAPPSVASTPTPVTPPRPVTVSRTYDPVGDAENDLVEALVEDLVARVDDGFSFDPEWDDPWSWAEGEIANTTSDYGPAIADRVEVEALDRMIDAAQLLVDEHERDEDL